MSKDKKIDIRNLMILISFFLVLVFALMRGKFLYGSSLDWLNQHIEFADYFRKLFYDTHELFPSFAFHLGAGQNIFNFSYYGLFNPLLLPSYFLPFLSMTTYIQTISILGVIASIILFYKWLKNHGFSSKITFYSTFLFLCAAPLIMHSHRQIMFVNYMPFLILGLMSIDTYFQKKKRLGLILSTFLIIMSSYYYSIPSILVLIIYGVYSYLKRNSDFQISTFLKEGIRFIIPIVIGILLASFLLLPTMYTILAGRVSAPSTLKLSSIFLPKMHLEYILYGSYSIGLTAVSLFGLVHSYFTKKKENQFLSIIMLILTIFPIFLYILNGGLYANQKVLIPFIPLLIFNTAHFLKDILNNKVHYSSLFLVVGIIFIFALLSKYTKLTFFLFDSLALILAFLYYQKRKKEIGLILVLLVAPLITVLSVNFHDHLSHKGAYEYVFSEKIEDLFGNIEDQNIYRSSNLVENLVASNKIYNMNYYVPSIYSSGYNSDYLEFYTKTFDNPFSYRNYLMLSATNNVLFNMYMGVKNVVSTKSEMIGYEEVSSSGIYKLYQNENVLPIGMVRKDLMSKIEFDSLNYPDKLEAMMRYTIVNEDVESNFKSHIKKVEFDYSKVKAEDLYIKKKDNHYYIQAEEESTFRLTLPKLDHQILIIRFLMNKENTCDQDTSITIHNQRNTLTCKSWQYKNRNQTFQYILSSNETLSHLDITFSEGTYDISNIETYLLDYNEIKNSKDRVDEFYFDKEKTKGNTIEGNIHVTNDGYFSLSIPYDKNFSIYVNDTLIEYEKVNTAFIGFRLNKGDYQIKIVYSAPYQDFSYFLTGFAVGLCIIIWVVERGKNEKRKN